jgi:acyl-CoA dehydrogenase
MAWHGMAWHGVAAHSCDAVLGGRIHYGMRTIGICKRALDMMCERALERTTQASHRTRVRPSWNTHRPLSSALPLPLPLSPSLSLTQGERLAAKQLTQEKVADAWIALEQFKLLVLRIA